MTRHDSKLRDDALRIWQAGVAAVRSETLVRDAVRLHRQTLEIGDQSLELADIGRIVVVGAGKAGAGMAAAVEQALGPRVLAEKQVTGWVNVPADCVRPLAKIKLHPARPAGLNEPTAEGVAGAEEILKLVGGLGPDDVCLCLISGGGSALLPAPSAGVSLAEKQALTRHLSGAGADIQALNTVRKQLSRIKGGGLARACRGGKLFTLIISDVVGDPLDVIASGPTVVDPATPQQALAVLRQFGATETVFPGVFAHLAAKAAAHHPPSAITTEVHNLIIGNNARAVEAAGLEASRLGYEATLSPATAPEGLADEVGWHVAQRALALRDHAGPNCLISGGEPVVKLAPAAERGRGGRNQQLVLAALAALLAEGQPHRIAILSGGTDGEDGPTDAAGAVLDPALVQEARRRGLDLQSYLAKNDAYNFFEPLGGLIRTGPTHTNVMDLRVAVVDQRTNN